MALSPKQARRQYVKEYRRFRRRVRAVAGDGPMAFFDDNYGMLPIKRRFKALRYNLVIGRIQPPLTPGKAETARIYWLSQ
jgi:hypothetical protein